MGSGAGEGPGTGYYRLRVRRVKLCSKKVDAGALGKAWTTSNSWAGTTEPWSCVNHRRLTAYRHIHHDALTYPAYTPSSSALTYFSTFKTGTMGGFDFSLHNRNTALHAQGVPLPKATSTGTTIVGCLFEGGVVIAADTRATSGPIVADKNCEK